jgi:hypothetical protein
VLFIELKRVRRGVVAESSAVYSKDLKVLGE